MPRRSPHGRLSIVGRVCFHRPTREEAAGLRRQIKVTLYFLLFLRVSYRLFVIFLRFCKYLRENPLRGRDFVRRDQRGDVKDRLENKVRDMIEIEFVLLNLNIVADSINVILIKMQINFSIASIGDFQII